MTHLNNNNLNNNNLNNNNNIQEQDNLEGLDMKKNLAWLEEMDNNLKRINKEMALLNKESEAFQDGRLHFDYMNDDWKVAPGEHIIHDENLMKEFDEEMKTNEAAINQTSNDLHQANQFRKMASTEKDAELKNWYLAEASKLEKGVESAEEVVAKEVVVEEVSVEPIPVSVAKEVSPAVEIPREKVKEGQMSQREKNEQAMKEKIEQKIMHIVKGDSFNHLLQMHYHDGSVRYGFQIPKDDEDLVKSATPFLLAVISDDIESEYFSHYSVSTGMLDSHLKMEYIKAARQESNSGRSEIALIEKEIKVDHETISVETAGTPAKQMFVVNEANMGSIAELLGSEKPMDPVIGTFADVIGDAEVWKVGARSSSQSLAGNLVLIPNEKSYAKHAKELKFFIEAYAKLSEDNQITVQTGLASRLKMAASSGKKIDLFDDLEFMSVEPLYFSGFGDDEVVGQHYKFKDGNKIIEKAVFFDDFEVKLEQEIIAPSFNTESEEGKERIGIIKRLARVIKVATDGSMYADSDMMLALGFTRDLQVRVTPVIKGMMNMVKDLKKDLGFDFVYFGGAVKGDPSPYFKSSQIEMFVLGEARLETDQSELFLMLSNQMVRELEKINGKTLDVFERDSKTILEKAFNQDIDALKVFVGLEEERGNTLTEEERRILDEENMTAELFFRNAGLFMESSGFMKRLSDFIRKSTQDIENAGRYYAKDATFRHMVSDPLEVVRHMKKGRMAFDATTSNDMKGIAPNHVVTSIYKDGQYSIDYRKAVLGRFPNLHHLEIQTVNVDENLFLSREMETKYLGQFTRGKHQGVIYYSLYDMVAEGQSGADFDGDETVVIRNPEITSLVEPKAKFLDYSYLDGELVEGVPWKEDNFTKLEDIIEEESYNNLMAAGVEYHEGTFTLDKELLKNEDVEEAIIETIIKLDGMNNASPNVGLFTNIGSFVMELETLLLEKRDQVISAGDMNLVELINEEIRGYKRLAFFMTLAVRWEIDKPKHGGQFMKEMEFLNAFISPKEHKDLDNLLSFEKEYGIKLLRLFEPYANSNDLINQGLDKLGIARINLERSDWDKGGLNGSRTVYMGKGEVKGADYGTRYSRYIEEMTKIGDKHTRNIFVFEARQGFLNKAVNFINEMEYTHNVTVDLESANNAGVAVMNGRRLGVPLEDLLTTPERVLWSYKDSTSEIQKEIRAYDNKYRQLYREDRRAEVINIGKIPTEDIFKKLGIPKSERQEYFALMARRDLIMDTHKRIAESLTPTDPKESAVLAATLYTTNVRTEAGIRHSKLQDTEKVKEAMNEALNVQKERWLEKFPNRNPNTEESKRIRDYISRVDVYEEFIHSDAGLSSIVTLFPLGMVQLFEYLDSGEISTEEVAGRNAVVFMEMANGGPLPENVKEILRDIEGKEVTLKNGRWGVLSIDKEDREGRNRMSNAEQRDLTNLNTKDRYNEISKMTFERGAHLWNGVRKGTVVLTNVYSSGVKIFLENTKELPKQ